MFKEEEIPEGFEDDDPPETIEDVKESTIDELETMTETTEKMKNKKAK